MTGPSVPRTLVAELTYTCSLRCAYCSNPVSTAQRAEPLTARDWRRVIGEAEAMGVLQVHFTGGEPLLFPELESLVAEARAKELYVNLITSGLPLTRERLLALQRAGLDHLQLSLQAATASGSVDICGVNGLAKKLEVARWVKELTIPLTVNIVLHRRNLPELSEMLELAEALEPHRIELANAQYLGWAWLNRDQLLPSRAELEQARTVARAARERLRGKTDVLFVMPDYYTGKPRSCMQGWADHYLVITPDGLLLPCHAARDLPGLTFDDVRSATLCELWSQSPALNRYRGSDWQPEPCRSCVDREKDFGGCRCQAFRLTGDASAADPACKLAPAHHLVRSARAQAAAPSAAVERPLQLRRSPRAVGVG